MYFEVVLDVVLYVVIDAVLDIVLDDPVVVQINVNQRTIRLLVSGVGVQSNYSVKTTFFGG